MSAIENRRRRPPRSEALALKRQDQKRVLRLLLDWPKGMPPLRILGADTGTLNGLVLRGHAEICGIDGLGDVRYRITKAGRAEVRQ